MPQLNAFKDRLGLTDIIRGAWVCLLIIALCLGVNSCSFYNILKPTAVGPGEPLEWELAWEDNFDSFDAQRWEKSSHTFDDNLVLFSGANIVFECGKMKLILKKEETIYRYYTGAEYRTNDEYLYGKFVVRMKSAYCSGVISSFFTFRDPISPWNEIDIEFLGRDNTKIHLNYWDSYNNEHPTEIPLGFDAGEDFHEYSFEWQPGYIRWSIDGVVVYTITNNVPNKPQKIMMNIWASTYIAWAGTLDEARLPVCAEYDYVRYYRMRK